MQAPAVSGARAFGGVKAACGVTSIIATKDETGRSGQSHYGLTRASGLSGKDERNRKLQNDLRNSPQPLRGRNDSGRSLDDCSSAERGERSDLSAATSNGQ